MSNTNPLTGVGGLGMNLPQSQSGSNSIMGQMDFLHLLMIQLSYQDPMNPVNSQEFAAQLAQFSQLEQLTQMNQNLSLSQQTNLLLAQSVNNTMAAGMIGQTIVANGNQVELVEGEEATLNYNLSGASQTTTITIKNSAGATVRTIQAGPQSSGDREEAWDGKDDEGNELPEGVYTFSVSAAGSSGTTVQATTYTRGTITGVSYTEGMAQFLIGSIAVDLGDIVRVEG
jgi:flagellar basal-body rod modification protein FlgD